MLRLLRCEYMKLRRARFLLIGIAGTFIVPFFVIVKAVTNYVSAGTAMSLFALYLRETAFSCMRHVCVYADLLARDISAGSFVQFLSSGDGTYGSVRVLFSCQDAFRRGAFVCDADAVCLSDNLNERICRTADCGCSGLLCQCRPVKFAGGRVLPVVRVLSSCEQKILRAELPRSAFDGDYACDVYLWNCSESDPISERGSQIRKRLFFTQRGSLSAFFYSRRKLSKMNKSKESFALRYSSSLFMVHATESAPSRLQSLRDRFPASLWL